MVQSVLEMAKDLVMAQIQTKALAPEDMRDVLQRTHAQLLTLKATEEAVAAGVAEFGAEAPVVDWKASITRHTITCLVCGAMFKQLSVRHLREHGLDARSYRAMYGIPRTQPLSARATTAMRKKIVQQSRPWEKAPTYMKAQAAQKAAAAPKRRPRKAAAKKIKLP